METEMTAEELEALLRKEVEQTLGMPVRTPKDFDLLSNKIYEKTHEQINSFTLKRFYGYIDRGRCSRATLDIISRFAGHRDWLAFLQKKKEENTAESSSEEIASLLTADQLQVGDLIKLTWQSDREVLVRYIGDECLTILDSKNSKLRTGEVYQCNAIVNKLPLVLKGVKDSHGNTLSTAKVYVCGKKHGIVFKVL
ncbi:MAG: hypothetical protein MJZ35_08085 [Bacteroidaceae bacterium]|nr:hypothetical protein [Bacteroidaceae bacterium]